VDGKQALFKKREQTVAGKETYAFFYNGSIRGLAINQRLEVRFQIAGAGCQEA